MATLTTKERKALPEEIFGLPEDRKYPLTDEAHVRKAIQFFKFCPKNKRRELANNINKRMQELKMDVNVSKESAFYRYKRKTPIKESYNPTHAFYPDSELSDIEKIISLLLEDLAKENYYGVDSIIKAIKEFSENGTYMNLVNIEEVIKGLIFSQGANQDFLFRLAKDHEVHNPYSRINQAMKRIHELYNEFEFYNNAATTPVPVRVEEIADKIISDSFYFIFMRSDECKFGHVKEQFRLIKDVVDTTYVDKFRVLRLLKEYEFHLRLHENRLYTCESTDTPKEIAEKGKNIRGLLFNLKELMEHVNKVIVVKVDNGLIDFENHFSMNGINVLPFYDTTNFLKNKKNEIRNQIDIMLRECDINRTDLGRHERDFQLTSISSEHRSSIVTILTLLDNNIRPYNLKMYHREFDMYLTAQDVFTVTNLKLFKGLQLYAGTDYNRNPVYFAVGKESLYLIAKHKKDICLICLYEQDYKVTTDNLTCYNPADFLRTDKLSYKIIKFHEAKKECDKVEEVTEGLHIDPEGGIKFKFSPKKSYMDRYAENHKVLLENFKSKNYDSMKENLAVMFALINTIERDVLYNPKAHKISAEKKRDAEKARAFATNDFKTYMRELLRVEPSFNFNKYYEESDFGKLTILFKKDELLGMKRLFRNIMMG